MDLDLHAFNSLNRMHQQQEQQAAQPKYKQRADVMDALADARSGHGDRRAAQSKFSAEKISIPKLQRNEFAKREDEGFERLLEPDELQEWKAYNDTIKQAIFDAKTGKGPRAEDNPLVQASPSLAKEIDPLTAIMEGINRSKSMAQKLKAGELHADEKAQASSSNNNNNNNNSNKAAAHGRRSIGSLEPGSGGGGRAVSGTASHTNLFVLPVEPQSPSGMQQGTSLLAQVRARESLGGNTEFGRPSMTSMESPTVPPLQLAASPSAHWQGIERAVPHQREGIESPRQSSKQVPYLREPSQRPAVRFEGGDDSDDDPSSRECSGDGHGLTLAASAAAAAVRHGRRSESNGPGINARRSMGDGNTGASFSRASFNNGSRENPTVAPIGPDSTRFNPNPPSRLSMNGAGSNPFPSSSQFTPAPMTSMQHAADASRSEFLRLLHGGHSTNNRPVRGSDSGVQPGSVRGISARRSHGDGLLATTQSSGSALVHSPSSRSGTFGAVLVPQSHSSPATGYGALINQRSGGASASNLGSGGQGVASNMGVGRNLPSARTRVAAANARKAHSMTQFTA